MYKSKNRKLVLLAVLDGWGISPDSKGNAIAMADTSNMNRLWASYPHTKLGASGESVGLPRGEVGNTETGHINLGAGRIVYQDLARINMSIADGSFFNSKVLLAAFSHAKKNKSSLHVMGLVGAGGVHSNIEHLFAIIQMAAREKLKRLYIHIFTDGRDSPPNASRSYIEKIEEVIAKEGVGEIASVIGRYYAMDRDQRWERTAKAYFALTRGEGVAAKSALEAVEIAYKKGETDEFISPTIVSDKGKTNLIKDNDSVIFFNFRIDRPRQLSRAFVFDDLNKKMNDWDYDPHAINYDKKHEVKPKKHKAFERGSKLKNLHFVTMTEYGKPLVKAGAKPAFPPEVINMPLARIISTRNLGQLHMSESEKERFVTFYFNGLHEKPFLGEDRLIVNSPKVATYDLKPEMSAEELTDKLLKKLKSANHYSFVIVNYANADMVAHTGNLKAAIEAVETVDKQIGRLEDYIQDFGGTLMITADHGNAEDMLDDEGNPETEHSGNLVPFIAVSKELFGNHTMLRAGILADVAPTVLAALGIQTPSHMMGRNLLEELKKRR